MTFSLAARDPRTGDFGMAVTSSSPAVGARCMHLRTGWGAVASQNVTNPHLGTVALDALAAGASAQEALTAAVATDPKAAHRQLTAVDGSGRTAAYSGSGTLGTHHVASGPSCIAAGNLLSSPTVVDAMVSAYLASTVDSFEERLVAGLLSGLTAGGEEGSVRSTAIGVVSDVPWRVTDLRVDDADAPIDELGRLVALWLPQKDAYRIRGIDPDHAPSFGVPGDL